MSITLTARVEHLLNDYFRDMSAGTIRRQAHNLRAELGTDTVDAVIAYLDTLATPAIEVEAAKTEDELAQGYYEFPEATRTGVVCGQCSASERDRTGDRKAQVRHASAALVRYCFGTRAAMDAETKADLEAERRVELYFEGAFDMPSAEDAEEDARERWLASLQD